MYIYTQKCFFANIHLSSQFLSHSCCFSLLLFFNPYLEDIFPSIFRENGREGKRGRRKEKH